MTTAVWDGKSVAADRLTGYDESVAKIWKLEDGSVVAGAGFLDDIIEVVAWLREGAKSDKKPDIPQNDEQSSDIFIASPDGQAYWLTWPYLRKVKVNEPFYAVGTGAKFALGALACGRSAKQAVEVAARFDRDTGRGLDVVRVVPARTKDAAV